MKEGKIEKVKKYFVLWLVGFLITNLSLFSIANFSGLDKLDKSAFKFAVLLPIQIVVNLPTSLFFAFAPWEHLATVEKHLGYDVIGIGNCRIVNSRDIKNGYLISGYFKNMENGKIAVHVRGYDRDSNKYIENACDKCVEHDIDTVMHVSGGKITEIQRYKTDRHTEKNIRYQIALHS